MTEFDRGWNEALEAAVYAVMRAPVFPKKDHGGPKMDAERIVILECCQKQIEALKKVS